jgi:DNA-binding winged helix-turn-helix (wHTH) protein/Leucine-rich repeat (LRR) protein
MERLAPLTFGPFRLDTVAKKLWWGEHEVPIRTTPAVVLQMLVEHAPEVVTKEQILRHIWSGKYVSKVALRVCISEIRQALRDDVKKPQFVETVGRKGYRYIGEIEEKESSNLKTLGEGFEYIVGRREEVEQLKAWFDRARRGFRQVIFVTGEPGIGKTTLVEMLLAHLRFDDRHVRIGRGQCLEQYGEGEPYLPILEAFGRLCRGAGGAPVSEILSRCAPTWLIQMPALLSSADIALLQQRIQGANQQRMLRELVDSLEALTIDSPFVLVLEDLHWSDYSTLEFLSYLAQRHERLRLMIIGTYRPADLTTGHPFKKIKREMQVRRQCEELPLPLLSWEEVTIYMEKQLPKITILPELTNLVYRITEGNALFMSIVVRRLRQQIVERNGQLELPVILDDLRSLLRTLPWGSFEERLNHLSFDKQQIIGGLQAPEAIAEKQIAAAQQSNAPVLDLSELGLISLPEKICELIHLQRLNISNNNLRKLPKSMTKLTQLQALFLHGNPRLNLPPEILGPTWLDVQYNKVEPVSPSYILSYYVNNRTSEPLNEAKMILVGRGGVGKTSLVQQIVNNTFDPSKKKPTVSLLLLGRYEFATTKYGSTSGTLVGRKSCMLPISSS